MDGWAQRFWAAARMPTAEADAAGLCFGASAMLRSAHRDIADSLYALHPEATAPDSTLAKRLAGGVRNLLACPDAQPAYDAAAVRASLEPTASGAALEIDLLAGERNAEPRDLRAGNIYKQPRSFAAVRVAAVLPRVSELRRIVLSVHAWYMSPLKECAADAATLVKAASRLPHGPRVECLTVVATPLLEPTPEMPALGRRAASAAPLLDLLSAVAPDVQDLALSTAACSGLFAKGQYDSLEPPAGELERVASIAARFTSLRRFRGGNIERTEYMTPFVRRPSLMHLHISGAHKEEWVPIVRSHTQLRSLMLTGVAVADLAPAVGALTNLQALTLASCRDASVMCSVKTLTSLTSLRLHSVGGDFEDAVNPGIGFQPEERLQFWGTIASQRYQACSRCRR